MTKIPPLDQVIFAQRITPAPAVRVEHDEDEKNLALNFDGL